MDGIILVDKPKGWSSFDVVAKLRGRLRAASDGKKIKVGHTGTLDPMATGLLILVVGSYCKRAAEFSKLDKEYEAVVMLGAASSTDDEEGKKTSVSDRQPTLEEVQQVLAGFKGPGQQTPPAFSAIKIDGQRAYKLARDGKEVTIEPRNITIYEIKDVVYVYPALSFTVKVSSGTYIRSLARDIGQKLATGAYLHELKRTEVGSYNLADAQPVDVLTDAEIIHQHLLTP